MTTELEAGRESPLPAYARYGLTIGLVGAATLGAVLFDRLTQAPNLSLVFVLPVVIAAVALGWGPSVVAAVGGALAYNFFLIAPRYTLRVNSAENVWALVLLLITAALVSAVAGQSRRRADAAWQAADHALALQALAKSLMAAGSRADIAEAASGALARIFAAPAAVLLEAGDDLTVAATAAGADLSAADHEAARWALASRLPSRGREYPVEQAGFDFWPIITSRRQGAVIGVRLEVAPDGRPRGAERLIDIVRGYLAVALDREFLADQALTTRVEIESQRLKGDLLAAVSHDLKTPLSTILFTLQSLQKFSDQYDGKARSELLAVAEKETARLSGLVANLLEMGRLDAGAVVVRPQALAVSELVGAALERATSALANHRVIFDKGAPVMLSADPQLTEIALANILENAAKYAAGGSRIRVSAGTDQEVGWIEVEDEGPGFPEPIEPLFEKFVRGVRGDGRAPGTGLGLAIARGFAEVQGGGVNACNRTDRSGARVRMTLPLARGEQA